MTAAAELPLESIRTLARDGRVLDAWRMVEATGLPPKDWPCGEALHTVAGLVGSLGAHRLRSALEWRNWRADRANPRFFYQALFGRLRSVPGVMLAKEVAAFLETVPADNRKARADLLTMLAWLHALHRDFKPAFRQLDEALDLHGDSSWIHVEHSVVLQMADRYDEALAAARRAVALRPLYQVAVAQCADVLSLLGSDDEAIAMLRQGEQATQHPAFSTRLQAFYSEREDHVAALACLDRIEAHSPLMEKGFAKWLAGRRADFHYLAGNLDACLANCDHAGEGFHQKLAEHLRQPGAWQRPRVRLAVPFVRQHRMTCAPATLAAISAFWQQAHDHLAIAAAICHEGTPWHKERLWAEDHGFTVREFRVTCESLQAVINRGIPFTLTTSYITGGHLQACVGYDLRAGTVLMRDPTERHYREMYLDALLENHPLDGPRGMILIPADRAAVLDGLELPCEAAYNALHRLHQAIDSNHRMDILNSLAVLKETAPDGMIALEWRSGGGPLEARLGGQPCHDRPHAGACARSPAAVVSQGRRPAGSRALARAAQLP
jgi:tetratricopeptide (TPR) repeat protein